MEELKAWKDSRNDEAFILLDGVETGRITCAMNRGLLFIAFFSA